MRSQNAPLNLRFRDVARLRQLHGEPNFLHHLQQNISTGVQEAADVQVFGPGLAPEQVAHRNQKTN